MVTTSGMVLRLMPLAVVRLGQRLAIPVARAPFGNMRLALDREMPSCAAAAETFLPNGLYRRQVGESILLIPCAVSRPDALVDADTFG